eukprot:6489141-Amphidinium_carterae.4
MTVAQASSLQPATLTQVEQCKGTTGKTLCSWDTSLCCLHLGYNYFVYLDCMVDSIDQHMISLCRTRQARGRLQESLRSQWDKAFQTNKPSFIFERIPDIGTLSATTAYQCNPNTSIKNTFDIKFGVVGVDHHRFQHFVERSAPCNSDMPNL